jgi:hypothetical protein
MVWRNQAYGCAGFDTQGRGIVVEMSGVVLVRINAYVDVEH